MKLTKEKLKELTKAHLEYNKFLRQRHMPKITLEEYIDQVYGKVAVPPRKDDVYKQKLPVGYTEQPKYRSVVHTGLAVCAKKETRVYSGERQLLGIATMHKSNAVPVFAQQDAQDIANMRRN